MTRRFPFYIPSKGRADNFLTPKYLTQMGIPHHVVVEPQEVDQYREALKDTTAEVLELDMSYKEKYEYCDEHGLTKTSGSGPARNFIWDHAVSTGADWHWIMDDNIRGFFRLHNNLKVPCASPSFFTAMEDFILRYTNIAMAGPHYEMFAPRKNKMPPAQFNSRVYSCNFIRNDVPFRWRGRYNEDTILSIDMLKAGWCTALFYAFLQKKVTTQMMKGGNTDELYKDGTFDKSEMLARVHPDVAEVTWRFNRVHHYVDYKKFKGNILRRKPGLELKKKKNNYGMKLYKRKAG